MPRPFKVPFYPWFPLISLVIAVVAMIAMIIYNTGVALVFFLLLLLGYAWFHFFVKPRSV